MLHTLLSGNSLSESESEQFFGEIIAGKVDHISIAAALTAMKLRGETVAEIAGAAKASLAAATPFRALEENISDTCGTGGDGHNTFNISTAASLLAAAMGIPVAKHGNRSVSSLCGSADVLERSGVAIDLSPKESVQMLSETGFTFLFAPRYHGGFAHVKPVRQQLKTRTIFNILGPLVNPARPQTQVLGVYAKELCMPLAKTLQHLGVKHALVVHGSGLDELAIHGESTGILLKNNSLSPFRTSPEELGLSPCQISDLSGGLPKENAETLAAILAGNASDPQTNAVALNAAALLFLHRENTSLTDCFLETKEKLRSGEAAVHFKLIKEASHDLTAHC